MPDNINNYDGQSQAGIPWVYSNEVREHFFNPKNFASKSPEDFNGLGMVGSPICGDVMKVWIKVGPETEKIKDFKWQTFGCASAIASTSVLSVMVTEKGGMTLEQARKVTPQDIMKRLGGLPDVKVHCSVLGDKALRAAINDYYRRIGQTNKVLEEGKRVIDKVVGVTDKDIEQAVLDGARTIKELQQKTKVGTGDKNCLPEAGELLRFYLEKHS